MRKPLTEEEKKFILRRKENGATLAQIGEGLHCSIWTIRKWWRRQRDGISVRQRGRPKKGALSTYPLALREEAKRLKQAHRHWGPAMVKVVLQECFGDIKLPSDSQLAVFFQEVCPEAVQSRQRQQYPEKAPSSVHRPHERWQIDAQEGVAHGDEEYVTVLNVRDPAGALMIASRVFVTTTEKRWRKLTRQEVQAVLRTSFEEWGMPLQIQTDREVVYVGHPQQQFPSLFTLWLAGLGIRHILSRPRRPTDQAAEERNHRTIDDMALHDHYCESLSEMQQMLDLTRQRYNEAYPARAGLCHKQPPLETHPWARHSGRPFHSQAEWDMFHMEWVDEFLADQTWTRQVTENGQLHLNGDLYYVGNCYRNQTVSIRFNPKNRRFIFRTQEGQFIAELPGCKLDKADIIGYAPMNLEPVACFQLPLPLQGV